MYKDTTGRFLVQALFREHEVPGITAPFTLKKEDVGNYKSLHKLYMEYSDPSEYNFAMGVLGSWDHWVKLENSNWFYTMLQDWRAELTAKLSSEHWELMRKISTEGKTYTERQNAIKWLDQQIKARTTSSKRGRPTTEEVQGALKDELRAMDEIKNDAARLGLKVV